MLFFISKLGLDSAFFDLLHLLLGCVFSFWASMVAQTVKNLLAMQETWVWYLGREDLLEVGMATHSSILAWRITWTEEPGRVQRVRHDWVTLFLLGKFLFREKHPSLQYPSIWHWNLSWGCSFLIPSYPQRCKSSKQPRLSTVKWFCTQHIQLFFHPAINNELLFRLFGPCYLMKPLIKSSVSTEW